MDPCSARLPGLPPASTACGLYVHVPFCLRKCRYCDFYSLAPPHSVSDYLEGVSAEIARAGKAGLFCDTVYLGGGTPSLLSAAAVAGILERLDGAFRIGSGAEVTLEANPGTIAGGKLASYRAAGVNRLNLGVQSLREEKLRFLGRIHGPDEAVQAFAEARAAGFERVGIDLIYGLPGEGPGEWLSELEAALALEPDHLSCYLLTIEPGTPLGCDLAAGRLQAAAEETAAELFLLTAERLAAGGFAHYEISNFARDLGGAGGQAVSRHNLKYWTGAPYLGFGPGAHSFLPPQRFWNPPDLGRWLAALRSGKPPAAGSEDLDGGQQVLEALFLGLRTAWGVDLAGLREGLGWDLLAERAETVAEFTERGFLRVEEGRLFPTVRGMLVAERLAVELC